MSAIDEIIEKLPVDQLAKQTGAEPQEVEAAAAATVPALLGGLHANAQDPSGASSILEALGQHDPKLLDGGVDLAQVDTADGQKIVSHIFGDKHSQVVSQLGGLGGGTSSGLVAKLMPVLAPIVLSYVAKQVTGSRQAGGGAQGQQSSSALPDILGQVLAGAASRGAQPQVRQAPGGLDAGGIITNVLGGLLGGGRR